jgi:hypothetical protein
MPQKLPSPLKASGTAGAQRLQTPSKPPDIFAKSVAEGPEQADDGDLYARSHSRIPRPLFASSQKGPSWRS